MKVKTLLEQCRSGELLLKMRSGLADPESCRLYEMIERILDETDQISFLGNMLEVVRMYYLEGMTAEAIAEAAFMSTRTVFRKRDSGLKWLEKNLTDYCTHDRKKAENDQFETITANVSGNQHIGEGGQNYEQQ